MPVKVKEKLKNENVQFSQKKNSNMRKTFQQT